MKNYILLLIPTVLFFSCEMDEDDDGTYDFIYTEKSSLEISSYPDTYMKFAQIEAGEKIVFEYRFVADDNPNIADDEYTELIRFGVPSGTKSFQYAGEELDLINVIFTKQCFCAFPMEEAKDVPPIGTISGKKISEKAWQINMDVTFYGDEPRTINEVFMFKEVL